VAEGCPVGLVGLHPAIIGERRDTGERRGGEGKRGLARARPPVIN
jgi:hypothetical protein